MDLLNHTKDVGCSTNTSLKTTQLGWFFMVFPQNLWIKLYIAVMVVIARSSIVYDIVSLILRLIVSCTKVKKEYL